MCIHFSYEFIILTLSTLRLYDDSGACDSIADSPATNSHAEEGGYQLPLLLLLLVLLLLLLLSLFHRIMCLLVAPSLPPGFL